MYANGTTDPTALPAEAVLKMATINGAKSVLWDNEIGSLEVGKKVGLFSQISTLLFLLHSPFKCSHCISLIMGKEILFSNAISPFSQI